MGGGELAYQYCNGQVRGAWHIRSEEGSERNYTL